MFRRDVCSHKHCEAVLSPKHHTLGLSKHLKKTNSGLKRNSLSLTKLPGLRAYSLHAKICQGIRGKRKGSLHRDSGMHFKEVARFAMYVLSTEGKVQWFRILTPPPPPPAPSRFKCHRKAESMGSEARDTHVQVLFAGQGVLCHCFSFTRESASTLSGMRLN